MVEGGSRILGSFLSAGMREDGKSPVVDCVVVTVGPMFIGEGISVVPRVSLRQSMLRLRRGE
jgi:2,5-diamino-6-(ribosylamino)-4(3H)-pyrimidinone 5'-phosphate reductase